MDLCGRFVWDSSKLPPEVVPVVWEFLGGNVYSPPVLWEHGPLGSAEGNCGVV